VSDPIQTLAELPGVPEALTQARDAVDSLLWDRTARRRGRALSAESTLLGAWADAAFEGAEVPQATLRAGAVEDSPVGRTAARTLAMYAELPALTDLLTTAPLQALARLHAIVAVGSCDPVGRPRTADEVADPLRTKTAVQARTGAQRLGALADLLTTPTTAPALALAAVVHGELAATQPFEWGSGLIARASTRWVMRATGLDPDGWSIPEAGIRQYGRPKYVTALRGYAGGSPEGVAQWLIVHAGWVAAGATAGAELVPDLPDD